MTDQGNAARSREHTYVVGQSFCVACRAVRLKVHTCQPVRAVFRRV